MAPLLLLLNFYSQMSIFNFKKFSVVNERSSMKVNTDGVLLGAVMTVRESDRRVLDVGTGTGTIALMAAQRITEISDNSLHVDAIDIDEPSASEAGDNFKNSPWGSMLQAHNLSLDAFALRCEALLAENEDFCYDLICSNPPYFDNALQAPEERRNAARHTSTGLSYREILDFAAKYLSADGRVAMVLPADTEPDLTRYARMSGLHLSKITRVRTVPRKSPIRIIAEFSRQRNANPEDCILTIQNEGQYTDQYLSLTKEFYLFA